MTNPPLGWLGPALVWTGSQEDPVPACPAAMPKTAYEGVSADFYGAPPTCAPCACDAPPATCTPSSTMQARQAIHCQGSSVDVSPGVSPWSGACNSANAVAADAFCGSFPCVSSVEITPPVVHSDSPCTPRQSAPPVIPPVVADNVLACELDQPLACATGGFTCVPTRPAGFRTCVHHPLEEDFDQCPRFWPEKILATTNIGDSRKCSACTCGDVEDASCTVEVDLYGEGSCGTTPIGKAEISSDEYGCINVATGAAVVGKTAKVVSVDPGHCTPSGGLPLGTVYNNAIKEVFCCRPPTP